MSFASCWESNFCCRMTVQLLLVTHSCYIACPWTLPTLLWQENTGQVYVPICHTSNMVKYFWFLQLPYLRFVPAALLVTGQTLEVPPSFSSLFHKLMPMLTLSLSRTSFGLLCFVFHRLIIICHAILDPKFSSHNAQPVYATKHNNMLLILLPSGTSGKTCSIPRLL